MALWKSFEVIDDATQKAWDSLSESTVLKKPSVQKDPISDETILREYREQADLIGFESTDLLIEEFKAFLDKHDIPTFNLREVVAYMDSVSLRDDPNGYGWQWVSVRDRDAALLKLSFGTASSQENYGDRKKTRASDYYRVRADDQKPVPVISTQTIPVSGASWVVNPPSTTYMYTTHYSPPTKNYDRLIPMHALKKIGLIEAEFGVGKVAFVVSDYVTEPHMTIERTEVRPDPFLMAVVPNERLREGIGRFAIDVWDEPGFGIDKMIK